MRRISLSLSGFNTADMPFAKVPNKKQPKCRTICVQTAEKCCFINSDDLENNGSNDNSFEICRKFALKNKNIKRNVLYLLQDYIIQI